VFNPAGASACGERRDAAERSHSITSSADGGIVTPKPRAVLRLIGRRGSLPARPEDPWVALSHNDTHLLEPDELSSEIGEPLRSSFRPSLVDQDALALDPSRCARATPQP